jgi:carboxyl-terminal processing protease
MRLLKPDVFLLVFLFLWLGLSPLGAQSAPTKSPPEGIPDESMRLYFEAVTKIRKQRLPPLQNVQIVRGTLKAYVRSLDPFSDYLSPEEFKQYKLFQAPQYAGVGMEIERDKAGRIVCFPYPESPAMQAGIGAGDILEAVDGVSTADLSPLTVGLKIRGQEGIAVWLKVSKGDGEPKDIPIIRTVLEARSVLVEQQRSLPIVRFLTFTPRTPQELQNALRTLQNATAVVLDLRGTPGGAFFGAIGAAKLFLARGQKITGLKTQEGLKEYRNDLDASAPTATTLYLWQDAWTASAAEVFIAALSQNQRAVTIGTTTFGKGTVQDIIALSDGSALRLTTGYIQTPDGTLYHQQGLKPTYPLDPAPATTADYVAKTVTLMAHRAVGSPSSSSAAKPAAAEALLPQRSPPLDIQITMNPPNPSTAPATRPRLSLLCFDKDFDTERDAEVWAMEVRASLREKLDHYLIQRTTSDGIKFVVCLGPFKSKEEAEKKRPTLSDAMQIPLFTEEVEKTASEQ